jgi:hypothetical protein
MASTMLVELTAEYKGQGYITLIPRTVMRIQLLCEQGKAKLTEKGSWLRPLFESEMKPEKGAKEAACYPCGLRPCH